MMKTITRAMMGVAAIGMTIAPIAAQANTRAGDSGSVYATSSNPGLGRAANGESIDDGVSIILALLAAGLVITGIVFATDSDDEGQSPGT